MITKNLPQVKDEAFISKTPISALIEVCTGCNFDCVHCYIPEHKEYMPFKTYTDIIDSLRAEGTMFLTLTGGEIFCHKDIMAMIRYARECGLSVGLLTNLSLLNSSIIEDLKSLYVNEISTTIFSMNEEINDRITRRNGSLKAITENLALLKDSGISIEVKTPILSINVNDVTDVKKYAESNGFKFNYTAEITPRTDGSRTPVNYSANIQELSSCLSQIGYDKIVSERGGFDANEPICRAIHYSISIDCKCNVYPCNSFLFCLGNLQSTSLKDILLSQGRKMLLSLNKSDLKLCKSCGVNHVCLRCPGYALLEGNGLYGCSEISKRTASAHLLSCNM